LEKTCYPPESLLELERRASVDYFDTNRQEDLMAFIRGKDYTAIFTKLGLSMDKSLMQALPRLQYIVTPTTGLNHIDLKTAGERNIEIISLKGEQEFLKEITSTAEHTWALLLSLIRHIPAAKGDVLQGNWRREPFLASELYGKTLGIIGYGRLGKIVARYGLAFGMKVLANDTDPAAFDGLNGVHPVPLDELLKNSDVISLHIPYTENNRQFFNGEKLEKTKPGSVLVNTSRGEVADEAALLEYLSKGHLAGVATDVLEGDSIWENTIPPRHPLIAYATNHENLLITPHTGGYGRESIERTRRFISGKFIASIKAAKAAHHKKNLLYSN
jgi:D-3-phosphoglycerate dehydrogenase